MTSTNTAARKGAKAAARLSYEDQLHVWLVGLCMNIFGLVRHNPVAFDLLIDRGLAVDELNRHCDVAVTEQTLRSVLDTFADKAPPYSATPPPSIKKKKTPAPTIKMRPIRCRQQRGPTAHGERLREAQAATM